MQLDQTSYSATEGDDVIVTVVTDRLSVNDVTVTLETSDNTAQGNDRNSRGLVVVIRFVQCVVAAPGDYTSVSRVVTIPSGQTSVPVVIQTTEDTVAEQTENFDITLSNPSDAILGSRDRATVQIDDDDGK